MTMETDICTSASKAILSERERRDYHVTVARAECSSGIAGIPMPKDLECYVASTFCTIHEHPCQWVDWAFLLPDGTFRVVLESDLSPKRPGMIDIEECARTLFADVQKQVQAMKEIP